MLVVVNESPGDKSARWTGRKGVGDDGECDWITKELSEEMKTWGHAGGQGGKIILKFDGERQVRRIRLTNDNLYRFSVSYWDERREDWRDVATVRQRRDVEGAERIIQPMFDFGSINFRTDRIRIDVTRTVDDVIVTKAAPGPNDRVIEHGWQNIGGRQREYFRILIERPARVREVEVYGLADGTS